MVEIGMTAGTLRLVGGRLCLDFANTVRWHASELPRELLTSYADLVAWSQRVGILTEVEAARLLGEAIDRPADAAAVLERAIVLREVIYRVFSGAADRRRPAAADLATLNAALADALVRMRIVLASDGFAWGWIGGEGALDRILWPIAQSAAVLLTSPDVKAVRECAGDGCGWLFVDVSRNRRRRWCDMNECGNRAKARRHYERRKGAR